MSAGPLSMPDGDDRRVSELGDTSVEASKTEIKAFSKMFKNREQNTHGLWGDVLWYNKCVIERT